VAVSVICLVTTEKAEELLIAQKCFAKTEHYVSVTASKHTQIGLLKAAGL
jgi:hypothetical protein